MTGGRALGKFLQPLGNRPQNKAQAGWRGLEQRLLEHGELAKADAMLAQGGAGLLIQCLHIFGNLAPRNDAEILGHPVGKAAGKPGQRLVLLQGQQRFEGGGNLAVDKVLQPALHLGQHIGAGILIDKGHDLRL